MKTPLVYKQLRQVLSVYNKRDKEKLFLVAMSQVFLAFLDLLGVALLGVIGALSVYGIQSKSPGNRVNQILELSNTWWNRRFCFDFQNRSFCYSS
jgi:ATP-binding cassette subfamily C protein